MPGICQMPGMLNVLGEFFSRFTMRNIWPGLIILGIVTVLSFALNLFTCDVSPESARVAPPGYIPTEANLRVAFIGDSADGSNFASVINLIKQEGTDIIMHQGDFAYASEDMTSAWSSTAYNAGIPYLGSDGNHDNWSTYVSFFAKQIQQYNLNLVTGSVSSGNYAVEHKGLYMVYNKEGGDASFSQQALANDNHIWKICSWHLNRHDFQAGGKGDDVSLKTYQNCINGGALVATAHEHSYSRTYSLSDLSCSHHGAFGRPEIMQIAKGSPGKSFIFVSGLAGKSSRDYHAREHDDDSWWATIYTSNRYCKNTCTESDFSGQNKSQDISSYNYDWGVLFIDFYVDGDPYKARGYFKNIRGEVIDEFTILVEAPVEAPGSEAYRDEG
jgi:hypothetical protein